MMLIRCFRRAPDIAIVETEMSMKTVQLAKDDASGDGGCPSVHWREDGMAVVQAQEVDADTFAGLPNVLPGERAVYIRPDVILRAADEIRKRGLG
jgi:capsule polysaccharide export protein KpsC/LpsZ